MHEAVNGGVPFTKGKYNLLRVVAAFPLEASFESWSAQVKRALSKDVHPLATLPARSLTSALATCRDGQSIVDQLVRGLKRARAEPEEDEAEEQGPKAKRRAGSENRVPNLQ